MPNRKGLRSDLLVRSALLTILILVISIIFVRDAERLEEARISAELTSRLETIIAGMRSELELNTSLVHSLAAFVRADPDFTSEAFVEYASVMRTEYPNIVNMAAAPDLVVTHIYPLEGNEAALGLDYRTREAQLLAVNLAIETRGVVFAGPLELVQGGEAFVIQLPVFLNDDSFWGIVSIPILTDRLYRRAGLFSIIDDATIAIRGRDSMGESGDLFFGNGDVFEHPEVQILPVAVGAGYWEIAGIPPEYAGVSDRALIIIAVTWLILILNFLGFLILALLRRKEDVYQQSLIGYQQFLKQVEGVSEVGGWRLNDRGEFAELTDWARKLLGIDEGVTNPGLDAWVPQYSEKSNSQLKGMLAQALKTSTGLDEKVELLRADGKVVWLYLQADPVQGEQGIDLLGAVQDVTAAEIARKQIEFQSNYDHLTSLPNRLLLSDRLESEINRARRAGQSVAVCFLDVDNFKSINDTLGHEGGDRFIVELAKRLQQRLRKTDTIARYSGDEFVLVLSETANDGYLVSMLEDLLGIFRHPFKIMDSNIYSSASIGVAMFPSDSEDAQSLILMADQAMYSAKKGGKNDWEFYQADMQALADSRNRLYNSLVAALDRKELQVFFQPIIETATGRIAGCESLVRWQRDDQHWISPDLFIDIAEERGLVSRIDLLVAERAIAAVREINAALDREIFLSLNVSPRVLSVSDAASEQWVDMICSTSGVALSVEITERVLMDSQGRAGELLQKIRNSGKGLSLDDFGTGYSGLSYLTKFPLTTIKIDQSFIRQLFSSGKEKVLVANILNLAGELGLKVVAEGVEEANQYEFLRGNGCDYVQGYYLSRPLPLEDFRKLCQEWTGLPPAS